MDATIGERMDAPPERILALAAQVEAWPHLLPHYQSVQVLGVNPAGERLVQMVAWRELRSGWPVAWPLRWRAIETLRTDELAIEFRHVRGITRGMWVRWQLRRVPGEPVEVSIRHVFTPRWPVPDGVVSRIVGDYFVNGVARRTLRCIRELAEGNAA